MEDDFTKAQEQELVEAIQAGDDRALTEMVRRLEKELVNFVYRHTGSRALAEDIFQETWVRVLRSIGTYEPRARFKTWVFTIARNLCMDHFKRAYVKSEKSLESFRLEGGSSPMTFRDDGLLGPDEVVEHDENVEIVRELVDELDPLKREALIFRYFQGLTYKEISAITGDPAGTLKFRVHQAVKEIGEMFRKRVGDNR